MIDHSTNHPASETGSPPAPTARELALGRKLGRRIRLGAEPIGRQLDLRFRAIVAMTGILAGVGSMFLAIFAAFGRPDVGFAVGGLILGPVAAWAWLDFALLRHRALAYDREVAASEMTGTPPAG